MVCGPSDTGSLAPNISINISALEKSLRRHRVNAEESFGHLLKHSHGPHAGNLLRTPHEVIEISIFEHDGLAYLRLYFYNHAGHPVPSPGTELIKLRTLRPNGVEERFALRPHEEAFCLESMSPVPRPFTFTVRVTVERNGAAHTCEVKLDEENPATEHKP